jgi:signal transduction histidine kinase
MRKSLRWKIFGYIIFAVFLIFLINRTIAQRISPNTVYNRAKADLVNTMENCKGAELDRFQYLGCAVQKTDDVILGGLTKFYVICPGKNNSQFEKPAVCDQIDEAQLSYSADADSSSVEIGEQSIKNETWVIARFKSDSSASKIVILRKDIDSYVDSLWDFRTKIATYTGPFLLLSLSVLTWFCSNLIMGPIRQIEESLKKLSSKNLDQPIDIVPVYKEFDSFISVFELLRIRLNESFVQARRFAGDASHELKTPLTILRGNAERVIAQLPTGSEEQIRMRSVADEVERLIEITEKLLLLSSADANIIQYEMREASISDVIGQLVLDAQIFQSKLNVTSELQPKICWNCDQNLINQLFYNLYTNAVKYNIEGGWIKMRLVKNDRGFEFSMSNPTANPPDDLAKKAFDRFYRGDSSRARDIDGLGLGLSLAQEIARVHGSELRMEVSTEQIVTLRLSYPATVL